MQSENRITRLPWSQCEPWPNIIMSCEQILRLVCLGLFCYPSWIHHGYILPRQGFDWVSDEIYQNLGSDLGFLKALQLLLRVVPLGLLFGGVPCDSFIFLSSSVHQRDATNPWGNPWPFVFQGNVLCTRFCLIALMCICRGCVWMLENPLRTAIEYMPPVQLLLQKHFHPLVVKWYISQCFDGNSLLLHVPLQLCCWYFISPSFWTDPNI